jgi:hypothetical protein
MAMELFMYLIYLAYMKKLDCPHFTSLSRACKMLMLPLVSLVRKMPRFCFLETKLKRATVTSRSMDVASFRSIVVLSFVDSTVLVPLSQPICRLFVGVLQPHD